MADSCAICGVAIAGRADRLTCSPRCKKALQRQSTRTSPAPPDSGVGNPLAKPDRGDRITEARPNPSDGTLSPLIDVYTTEKRLPPKVAEAFARAGVEPPHRDTIDQVGYTFAQRAIIDREAA